MPFNSWSFCICCEQSLLDLASLLFQFQLGKLVIFPRFGFQGKKKESIDSSLASVVESSSSCFWSILSFPQIRRAFRCWTAEVDIYRLQYLFPTSFFVCLFFNKSSYRMICLLSKYFLSHRNALGTMLDNWERTTISFILISRWNDG